VPRLTTRSGQPSSVKVVQEIIYPVEFTTESASISPNNNFVVTDDDEGRSSNPFPPIAIYPSSFETRETGVILDVTPTVGPDGYTIELLLAPEVAELVDWLSYGTEPYVIKQPVFTSRNINTSINIWDGQTVVMGGLMREELVTIQDGIPILQDIPLLGRLFRTEGERSIKTNLLMFVTARVVDPAGNPIVRTEDLESRMSTAGSTAATPE